MGTRADFYLGRGLEAKWLGSIAWDGYPGSINEEVLQAKTEEDFLAALEAFAKNRKDWTPVSEGWPWPWEDSRTTDYAYAFDGGKVRASRFGSKWFDPIEAHTDEGDFADDPQEVFPDMTAVQNVTLGPRSGIIMVSGGGGKKN